MLSRSCIITCRRSLQQQRCYSMDIPSIKSKLSSVESTGHAHLEIHDNLAKIIFENPGKRNAFSTRMVLDLHNAILKLEDITNKEPSSLKYLLMTSRGGYFCAGGDKALVQQILTKEKKREVTEVMHDSAKRLSGLPLLSASYVEGGAIGGGAELSLWTDFLLLHSSSGQIGYVHSKMGLLPAWASGHKLVKQIGPRLAYRMLLLGEILKAQEAQSIGLAHGLVSSEDEAIDWLKTKTAHLTPEMAKKIRALVELGQEDKEAILDKEIELLISVWCEPTHLAAIEKNLKHRS